GFGPAGLGVLPQTTLFVMDNLSWCALIGLAVSNPLCGESLCAEIFQECGTQCDEGPEAECESFGCCVSFSWSEGTSELDYCDELPLISGQSCCFEPEAAGSYTLSVSGQLILNGELVLFTREVEVDFAPCQDVTIDGLVTWSEPFNSMETFDKITVQSGAKLIIGEDVQVGFCETGKLIIEPGGLLELYGTLTAGCDAGWE